jgi:hypothetical protein
VKKAE